MSSVAKSTRLQRADFFAIKIIDSNLKKLNYYEFQFTIVFVRSKRDPM